MVNYMEYNNEVFNVDGLKIKTHKKEIGAKFQIGSCAVVLMDDDIKRMIEALEEELWGVKDGG